MGFRLKYNEKFKKGINEKKAELERWKGVIINHLNNLITLADTLDLHGPEFNYRQN